MNFKKAIFFTSIFIIMLILHIYVFQNIFYTKEQNLVNSKKDYIMKINIVEYMSSKIEKNKSEEKKAVIKSLQRKQKIINKTKEVKVSKILKKEKKEDEKFIIKNNIKKIENKQENKKIVSKISKTNNNLVKLVQNKKDDKEKEDKYLKIYISYLHKTIYDNKFYPKMAKKMGLEGTSKIKFRVLKTGEITDILVFEKSSFSILNKASIDILKKIKNFNKFPKYIDKESIILIVPIVYKLKG